jgi:hypothetical protein
MVLHGTALMVNLRRLHRRREEKRKESSSAAEKVLVLAFLLALGLLALGLLALGQRGAKFGGEKKRAASRGQIRLITNPLP